MTSALYDARHDATPAQLKAMEAKRARQLSMSRAAKADKPLACPSASQRAAAAHDRPKIVLTPRDSYREAFERAAREHPIVSRFETWFRMVDEGSRSNGTATIKAIQRAVVFHFEFISLRDLLSKRRYSESVLPRQIAMYICKVLKRRSFREVGNAFGGRDHTTAIFAVRKIEGLIRSDPAVAQDVGEIINNLGCRDV